MEEFINQENIMSETKKENLETEQKKKSKDQLIDEVQTESRQKLQKVIDFIKKNSN